MIWYLFQFIYPDVNCLTDFFFFLHWILDCCIVVLLSVFFLLILIFMFSILRFWLWYFNGIIVFRDWFPSYWMLIRDPFCLLALSSFNWTVNFYLLHYSAIIVMEILFRDWGFTVLLITVLLYLFITISLLYEIMFLAGL